jgi:hypothetical protein
MHTISFLRRQQNYYRYATEIYYTTPADLDMNSGRRAQRIRGDHRTTVKQGKGNQPHRYQYFGSVAVFTHPGEFKLSTWKTAQARPVRCCKNK